jgi:hypothetical protein
MFYFKEETELVTLYTHSRQDLLESLSEILECNEKQIEDAISNLEMKEEFLYTFFELIGLNANNRMAFNKLISFDSLILSHLSSRISEPNSSDKILSNLHQVLTEKSDLSSMFLKYGVRFAIRNKRIVTYYDDVEVNWNNYTSYQVARVKNRLMFRDKCVNGFLFNDQIWKDSRVRHLCYSPEILEDISSVLQIKGIIDEWRESAKLYVVGVRANLKDIYLDGINCFSLQSKILYIYKQSLSYLKMCKNETWSPENSNIMIRLKDHLNVSPEDYFGHYEVSQEDIFD